MFEFLVTSARKYRRYGQHEEIVTGCFGDA